MESKPLIFRSIRYLSLLAVTIVAIYVSSIPAMIGYYDATANRVRTLTPNTQAIIKELGDEPLEVTAYNNLFGTYWFLGAPESYNLNQSKWDNYLRFKHNIKINTVMYYDLPLEKRNFMKGHAGKNLDQIAEQYTKSMKIKLSDLKKPGEINQIVDLKPELNRYVMQLKWKDRTTFLRIFDDAFIWPSETEVAAALKRLLQAELPKIAFLRGHLERDVNKMGDKDYKALTNYPTFRNSLINQGFDVDSISLDSGDVPANIATLVIADPKIPFSAGTMDKIEKYISQGGNLLIAGEPGRQSILNPLLSKIGVQLNDGMVVQESKEFSPEIVTTEMTAAVTKFYKPLVFSKADSAMVAMPSVTGITYSNSGDFKVEPLLLSNPKLSWTKKEKLNLDLFNTASSSAAGPSAEASKGPASGTLTFAAQEGDQRGAVATAVSLQRKINGKEQRIIVLGDADFVSNTEMQRYNMRTANFIFSTGLFSWLSYQQFPIDTSRPPAQDKKLNLSLEQVDFLRIVYIWIMPGTLLLCGAILLLRRKRQ